MKSETASAKWLFLLEKAALRYVGNAAQAGESLRMLKRGQVCII
jgi:hypothetical protein